MWFYSIQNKLILPDFIKLYQWKYLSQLWQMSHRLSSPIMWFLVSLFICTPLSGPEWMCCWSLCESVYAGHLSVGHGQSLSLYCLDHLTTGSWEWKTTDTWRTQSLCCSTTVRLNNTWLRFLGFLKEKLCTSSSGTDQDILMTFMTTWFVCWSRVRTKLYRAAALRNCVWHPWFR